eukprot:3511879-Amphidinium_carterae.1
MNAVSQNTTQTEPSKRKALHQLARPSPKPPNLIQGRGLWAAQQSCHSRQCMPPSAGAKGQKATTRRKGQSRQ